MFGKLYVTEKKYLESRTSSKLMFKMQQLHYFIS